MNTDPLYGKALYYTSGNTAAAVLSSIERKAYSHINLLLQKYEITKILLKDIEDIEKYALLCLTDANFLDVYPFLPTEKLTAKNITNMFYAVVKSVKFMNAESQKKLHGLFYPLVKKHLKPGKRVEIKVPREYLLHNYSSTTISAFDLVLEHVPISWRPMLEYLMPINIAGADFSAMDNQGIEYFPFMEECPLMIAMDNQGIEYFPFMEEYLTHFQSLNKLRKKYDSMEKLHHNFPSKEGLIKNMEKIQKFLKYIEMKNEGTLTQPKRVTIIRSLGDICRYIPNKLYEVFIKPSPILTDDEISLILSGRKAIEITSLKQKKIR